MTIAARAAIADKVTELFEAFEAGMRVQTDPNDNFNPPDDAMWGRVAFADGGEQVFPGSVSKLVRKPLLAFIDAFAPIGHGDGGTVAAIEHLRLSDLRIFAIEGMRFVKFQEGPEGKGERYYGKQLIAVFRQSFRV